MENTQPSMQSKDLQLQEAVFLQEHEQESVIQRRITEWLILARIQFTIIREAWVWIFIMACMFPLTTSLFLKFFTVDPTPAVMTRIITGNMLFGLIVMGLNSMAQEISYQKHQGHFTYYSSLPIAKVNFIFANLFARLDHERPSLSSWR